MSNFVSDFKAFVMRGNVVDMAVGIIIGGAFGKIISSLVADVIMPVIGLLFGGIDFTSLKYVIRPAELGPTGEVLKPEAVLAYGNFIQTTVDFIIIAFAIYVMITAIAKLRKPKEEAPAAPPAPTNEEVLLTQIRDLLKEQQKK
ncbi:MAG: large-conductance mechanosensitive channel protein MscL [Bacteroidales bacterium]